MMKLAIAGDRGSPGILRGVILVAVFILNEQDKLTVTTPNETSNRAFGLIGQQARVGEGSSARLTQMFTVPL
jgi:hypothetical protein